MDSGTTDVIRKALGGTDGTKKYNHQPFRDWEHQTHNNTRIRAEEEGGAGGRGQDVEKEEHEKKNDEKERSAAQTSVSFSLNKETEEPPPLPFLISHLLDMTGSIRRSCKNK